MKINLKEMGIEAEGNIEDVAKRLIDSHDKNWQKKFKYKHKAKKEMLELKRQQKMDKMFATSKRTIDAPIFDYLAKREEHKMQKEKQKQRMEEEKLASKSKPIIKIIGIILFFIYGVFCILSFKNNYIVSSAISIFQIISIIISIFTSMNIFYLFKNDYKVFLLISLLLIIPWLAFVI